jgi:hypothetical protein
LKKSLQLLSLLLIQLLPVLISAQESSTGSIHGNFQLDAQYYIDDTIIGAPIVPEKLLCNGFANFIYNQGNFSAGLRYENYTNPLLGYDANYKGNGIPYRYLNYKNNELDITAGNFYEQFGNGLVLRTYEDWGLGYDNSIDGLRVKYNPFRGIYIKGVIGYQRDFWSLGKVKDKGIVRGADAEWNLNETLNGWDAHSAKWIIGGSFVSKYQIDNDPIYILPENVGTGAGRITFMKGDLTLNGEFAYKINDPSATNGYIYKDGNATLLNATYSAKGIGFTLAAKRIDNMSFRSDRTATLNSLIINYLPAVTKNHTYLLPALYPYATQPNGEFGFQGEFFYNIKPGQIGNGKYGTDLTIDYSRVTAISKNPTGDDMGYTTELFKLDNEVYYEDFNIEAHHKWSKKFQTNFSYVYINYNKDVIEGGTGSGHVFSHIGIVELNYKISPKRNIRTELQNLYTKQDKQSWGLLLAEYSVSPHWFLAGYDEYNYGNNDKDKRFHYYSASIGYVNGTNRIQVGYGRQRAGLLCVGGICRQVPASNGFTVSITSSF